MNPYSWQQKKHYHNDPREYSPSSPRRWPLSLKSEKLCTDVFEEIEEDYKGKTSVIKPILTEEEEKMFLEGIKHYREGRVSPAAEAMASYFASLRIPSPDDRVDEFIDLYNEDIVDNHKSTELRNFIEKMAVWYELRYPDYEINRLMPCSNQEDIEISDIMFNKNRYINELLDENSDVRSLDWEEFYNTNAFINSLPLEEKSLLKPRYRTLVYVDVNNIMAHLHLTTNGIVRESEGFGEYTAFIVKDEELKGMHVKEVVELLKKKGISLPNNNELEDTINNVEYLQHKKEGILDCVMYRIIERGKNRTGPRRAFLFAKEFERDIDIPMMYGVNYSDPGLRQFINEYIKAGGSKELMCYVGYFSRENDTLETVSIKELIKTIPNDCATKYTLEETELHQRIADVLESQVDQKELRKEEVKQLRIQRKLEKSRITETE